MGNVTTNELKSHLFLRDVPESLLELLTPLAEEVEFSDGELLIEREQDADAFYLIRDGLVSIQLSDPGYGKTEIDTLSEGNPIGWSWAHPPYVWQFTARVQSDTTCFRFPAEDLRERCEMEPELGFRIYRQLLDTVSDRLAGTRLQLLDEKDVELPEAMMEPVE